MRLGPVFVAVGSLVLSASTLRAEDPTPPGVRIVTRGFVEQVVLSGSGRHVAWPDGNTLVRHDVDTAARRVTPLAALDPTSSPAAALGRIHALSDDGRYVAYAVLVDPATTTRTLDVWADLDTGARRVLRDAVGLPIVGLADVTMSRDGQTLAWLDARTAPTGDLEARVLVWRAGQGAAEDVGRSCLIRGSAPAWCIGTPGLSGDGRLVMYTAGTWAPEALAVYDTVTATRAYYPEVLPLRLRLQPEQGEGLVPSTDGRYVVVGTRDAAFVERAVVFDRVRRRIDALGTVERPAPAQVSDDGARVRLSETVTGGRVLDRRSGVIVDVPRQQLLALSADGTRVLGRYAHEDGSGWDLRVTPLDADEDGMLDGWERRFGLDPTTAADAAADADGDGLRNVDEYAQRSHPTAVAAATRWFAEGAAGTFFDTVVSVFNPTTRDADIVVRFVGPAGTAGSRVVRLAPLGRTDVASCCLEPLEADAFGVVVESTAPVVAERRMTWDRRDGYGSHASTGVASPATTWYFAEGATVGGFQTFLLLQNPSATTATVTVSYLRDRDGAIDRTYDVPAGTRRTVWVNQEGPALAAAQFGLVVHATQPIVAERSMYRDAEGRAFSAGTNVVGVGAPSTAWDFAEGSTAGPFDTFLLLGNPGDAPAQVRVTLQGRARGAAAVDVERIEDVEVPARSRRTLWLDQLGPSATGGDLSDADVSIRVRASSPVVAERAMWWQGPTGEWIEGHAEFGAVERGTVYGVADVEVDPGTGTDTYLLALALTPTPQPRLRVQASTGTTTITRVVDAGVRTTLSLATMFPELAGRYSVIVSSLSGDAAGGPIVVERATYGRGLRAGAACAATRLAP